MRGKTPSEVYALPEREYIFIRACWFWEETKRFEAEKGGR